MHRARTYRQTTLLLMACVSILLGLGWARVAPEIPGVIVLVVGLFGLLTLRRRNAVTVIAMISLGLVLGWWRGGLAMHRLDDYADLRGRSVVVEVTADTDSANAKSSQIGFDAIHIRLIVPLHQAMIGRLGVSGFGERMIYRGDTVRVTGKFYMTRGSKVATMSFANIQVVRRSHNKLYDFQRRFAAGMQNALPEPHASFAMGLLIGAKSGLDKDTAAILSSIGLTHIIAVSGYNLTIIIRAMRKIFGRFSKYQMMMASLLLIGGFLVITGLGASIVRASIVSSLSLLGWFYGRRMRPLLMISFTAASTALWNPLYVWSDIGWYLSFLAFFGVMIVGPLIQDKIAKDRPLKLIGGVVIESLCAELMTLPFILYIFGVTSLIALPANVLIVPLLPLAMLGSFAAGLAGTIVPSVAGWIAWPGRLLLTYLLEVANLLERIPHMRLATSISIWYLVVLYLCIVVVLAVLFKKTTNGGKLTEVNVDST